MLACCLPSSPSSSLSLSHSLENGCPFFLEKMDVLLCQLIPGSLRLHPGWHRLWLKEPTRSLVGGDREAQGRSNSLATKTGTLFSQFCCSPPVSLQGVVNRCASLRKRGPFQHLQQLRWRLWKKAENRNREKESGWLKRTHRRSL